MVGARGRRSVRTGVEEKLFMDAEPGNGAARTNHGAKDADDDNESTYLQGEVAALGLALGSPKRSAER